MIEEIQGPGNQSLLKLSLDLAGFEQEAGIYQHGTDLVHFQQSPLFEGAWVSSWGDWITLERVLDRNLSPKILAHLLETFAKIYDRHFGGSTTLQWNMRFVYFQLSESEGVFELDLRKPLFVRCKLDEAEDFFQNLLEIYLKSDDLNSKQAELWLMARDEEWPGLVEAILGRELDTMISSQTDGTLKIQRIDRSMSQEHTTAMFLPPAIPLACLTQAPPGMTRLEAHQIFWVEGRCVLGSSPELADYLLKSSHVLPEHCVLMVESNSYVIKTIGLGTVRVDGKTIGRNETFVLPSSCRLEIADVSLYFFMEAETDRRIA